MTQRDDIMKRLEALNGGPLRVGRTRMAEPVECPQPARPAASPIRYQRDLPREKVQPMFPQVSSGEYLALEKAVQGYEVAAPERGRAYKIKTPLVTLGKHWQGLRDSFHEALSHEETPLQQRIFARCGAYANVEDVLFVDLETTGLAQTPLFLIGTLGWEGDDLVVRQYLARHYGEEAAVISLFLADAREKKMLISFNGKSFDIPYVRTRSIANGLPCVLHAWHFDLLHESRRIWKKCLPNCKLQTLEQRVCGRPPRVGDIPGHLIPAAYHAFVRTGNAMQIAQIITHNMMDLVTLAELTTKLPPLEA